MASAPRTRRTSFMWRGVPSTRTEWGLYTPVIVPFPNWVVHRPWGSFTQTLSPTLYLLGPASSGGNVTSTPLIRAVYEYIRFAGAVDADASSLGVTLYQYTASITEHRVLAAMHFIVRWDLSTIPLPAGTYAHWNLIWTLQRSANLENASPLKVVALSVRSSTGAPFSQNMVSNCRTMLAASWHDNGLQIANRLGPQSIKVR